LGKGPIAELVPDRSSSTHNRIIISCIPDLVVKDAIITYYPRDKDQVSSNREAQQATQT
jgi:hypothetical protein